MEGGLAEPIRTTVSHQFGSTAGGDADMNTLQAVRGKRLGWTCFSLACDVAFFLLAT